MTSEVAKCMSFVFKQLKDDAVALVDVFAPPDFILNSPIGKASGEVRKPILVLLSLIIKNDVSCK